MPEYKGTYPIYSFTISRSIPRQQTTQPIKLLSLITMRPFPISKFERRHEAEVSLAAGLPKSSLLHRTCPMHPSRPKENDSVGEDELSQGRALMISNGWCTHQVNHLSASFDAKTFLYLATLQTSSVRAAYHQRCSSHARCVAHDVDLAAYAARHTSPGCNCDMVFTPYDVLINKLQRGQIPVISVEGDIDDPGGLSLLVYFRSISSRYVALSHVWADGLGNPRANALPSCQISRLKAALTQVRKLMFPDSFCGPILFWMDTL
ncbi:hypothetical protein F5Y16DRAFT_68631 [Xylariaceae sp. FL0255]|nr:hypothetical protein F5Y16DRAFT_68631 [Xylariaceae sp. FL0255]